MEIDTLQDEILAWQNKHWDESQQNVWQACTKLMEEVGEFAGALVHREDPTVVAVEAADIIVTVLAAANRAGCVGESSVSAAMDYKWPKVQARDPHVRHLPREVPVAL